LRKLRGKQPAGRKGGEAAGDRDLAAGDFGSSSAEHGGIRPPAPLVMRGRVPPRSPPPSPPPSSPPPSPPPNQWPDTPRQGQMRSSLRQLGVAEVGAGASLGDLFGELS